MKYDSFYHPSEAYSFHIRKAIDRRNDSRQQGIPENVRKFRLRSMRFWSTTAIVVARIGGCPTGKPSA